MVAAVPASTPRTTASDSPARLHARRFRLPLPHHSPTPPPSHRRHLVRRHGGWTSEGYDPDFRPKAFPISPENKEGVPVPPTFSSLAALDADGGQLQGLTLGEQYMHLYNKFYDECMRGTKVGRGLYFVITFVKNKKTKYLLYKNSHLPDIYCLSVAFA